MYDEDRRLDAARLRGSIRRVDLEIERIRTEHRLFQRYGFGSDVHDIQLTALRNERRELTGELERVSGAHRARSAYSGGIRSWLLLPAMIGAIIIQPFRSPRRNRRATNVTATATFERVPPRTLQQQPSEA